jgi:hypothetical protein
VYVVEYQFSGKEGVTLSEGLIPSHSAIEFEAKFHCDAALVELQRTITDATLISLFSNPITAKYAPVAGSGNVIILATEASASPDCGEQLDVTSYSSMYKLTSSCCAVILSVRCGLTSNKQRAKSVYLRST